MTKKALDVTTKGWSKEGIEKLRQSLIDQGVKYKVEIEMPDLKRKWLYLKDPEDAKPYCEQVGAVIINVEKF